MNTFTTKDGTRIFYKDWGSGPAIVFSHGWPLSSEAWDAQMLFFSQRGFRVIAHDRRGHGRSDQPFDGNDMDTYADDLAGLLDALGVKDAAIVGHSTGGGEVVRYIGRHGTGRVSKVVLLGAVPPLMLKTPGNPEGTPIADFDAARQGVAENRSQFFLDLSLPFYGFNRKGAEVSEGLRQSFWRAGMQSSIKAAYDCIKQYSETDFTADLKQVTVPTLVAAGDDDQIVPIKAAALKAVRILPDATLKLYPGGPHGFAQVHPDAFNADVLDFVGKTRT